MKACLEEGKNLEGWCQRNNLLNVSKTKDLVVDYSKKHEKNDQNLTINKAPVKRGGCHCNIPSEKGLSISILFQLHSRL